jgi:uncharacterized protein YaaQ
MWPGDGCFAAAMCAKGEEEVGNLCQDREHQDTEAASTGGLVHNGGACMRMGMKRQGGDGACWTR